ncbi:hypothetical protein F442_03841 [Phytophthora nicotianae P10297]|uniref:Uncharacterized protein n=1 Tax=Phytophthora nicotianae P10297 TaxID=1317064 RepID=W2ZV74_PHYNI|nr:hypothetical protein F442_03841 [Phytophthora nicotianae P10297]
MPKWKSALWLAIPQDNRASVPQMYQRYAATAGARESNEQQTESNDGELVDVSVQTKHVEPLRFHFPIGLLQPQSSGFKTNKKPCVCITLCS